ncbi:MAG: biotin--[acetyl-CoA-carboxylase] ligase [Flavobacteriaceae bacterium]
MKIIKISAIGSTNDYLKKQAKTIPLEDETVVQTLHQTQGKGQMGASWHFDIGKSLAFSIFKQTDGLPISNQFWVNFAVSLGVKKGLDLLGIPKVSIKWPNDILADGKKVCGILVENQFQKGYIEHSIIGIGINVNNTSFPEFPQASSLLLTTGVHFSLDEVFEKVLQAVLSELHQVKVSNPEAYKKQYESYLYKIGVVCAFEDIERKMFQGIIVGVSNNGLLLVKLQDNTVKEYRLKEIKMLY